MLRNPFDSISVRLIGSYLFLAAMTLTLGIVGYVYIGRFADVLTYEVADQAEARYLSTKIRLEVLEISNMVEGYLTADSDAARRRLAEQLADKPVILGEFANQLEGYGYSAQEREALAGLTPLIQPYLTQPQLVVDAYDAGEGLDAQTQMELDQFRVIRADLQERLVNFEGIETSLLEISQREARKTVDNTQRAAVMLSGIALVSGMLLGWWTARTITRPVNRLVEGAQRITAGDWGHRVEVRTRSELGVLAAAFNAMATQLWELFATLEGQVADRTRELERRSRYLEASAEVGRVVSSILDVDQLMQQVVGLIRERFELYYVGLFQVDEAGEWAVLRAGTGEAGRAMLERGHRIRVGEGMIGWSIANARPRIVLEAGEDAVRLATVELPETRSEAALPLRSRGQVLGALSVQSVQPGAFDEDTITVLQTMVDQVAVALDNARLFAASQTALERMQRTYGELSREAWRELLRTRFELGRRYDPQGILPDDEQWREEMRLAAQQGQTVWGTDSAGNSRVVAVPLKVREQVIGVLDAHKPVGSGEWSQEEVALLESLVDQLGVALESARLHQDARRRAAERQLVGEVTARMRETLDMETVLKTAAQEVRQVLDLPEVFVTLTRPIGGVTDEVEEGEAR